MTANKAMICNTHPISRIEDILAAMSGGVSFTKLDLSHAYLQLQLDETSRDYLAINTHKASSSILNIWHHIGSGSISEDYGQFTPRPSTRHSLH